MKKCLISSSYINGKGLTAHKAIEAGNIVIATRGMIQNGEICSSFAIQVDTTSYIELNGMDAMYINHSCEPNCFVDFDQINRGKLIFRALRNITFGEEITFNYNTTEYDMDYWKCSFSCQCGSANCIDEVKGFRYLGDANKEKIQLLLSPYLINQYINEKGKNRKNKHEKERLFN